MAVHYLVSQSPNHGWSVSSGVSVKNTNLSAKVSGKQNGFLFLTEDFCVQPRVHFISLFPIGPYGFVHISRFFRNSRADAGLSWGLPDSLMSGWNIAARLTFVCLFRPHSDEVRRNSAQAHHDLSELWPGSLQTHEVSRLSAIFAFFFFFKCVETWQPPAPQMPSLFSSSAVKEEKKILPFYILLSHFSIKHRLQSSFSFFFFSLKWLPSLHSSTYSFSSPHQSHFLTLLPGCITLLWFLRNLGIPVEGRHHSASSEPCAEDAAHLVSPPGVQVEFFFDHRLTCLPFGRSAEPCGRHTAAKAWLAGCLHWIMTSDLSRTRARLKSGLFGSKMLPFVNPGVHRQVNSYKTFQINVARAHIWPNNTSDRFSS